MKNNAIVDKRKGAYHLTYLLSGCRFKPLRRRRSDLSLHHAHLNRQIEGRVIRKMQNLLAGDKTRKRKGGPLGRAAARGALLFDPLSFPEGLQGRLSSRLTITSLTFRSWSFPGNHFRHLSSMENLPSTKNTNKQESDLIKN